MKKRRRSGSQPFSLFAFQDIITSVTGIMILVTLIMALELLDRVEGSPAAQTELITAQNEVSIEELQREIDQLKQRARGSQAVLADVASLPSLNLSEMQTLNDALSEDLRKLQNQVGRSQADLMKKRKQLSQDRAAASQSTQQMREQLDEMKKLLADLEQEVQDVGDSNRVYYKTGVDGKTTWLVEITAGGWMAGPIGVEQKPVSFTSPAALQQWLTSRNARSEAFFLTTKPGGVANFYRMRDELNALGFDVGFQVLGQDQTVLDTQKGASLP